MRITFIGLGRMGTAMVERLLKAGHEVTVFNRTLSKTTPLVALGAISTNSMHEAVRHANVIMTCLLDDKAVLEVTEQMLEIISPDTIHIGLSTILPDTAKILDKKHIEHNTCYISAVVLGVPAVVRKGELTAYCAGRAPGVKIAMQLLQAFSKNVISLGEEIFAPNVIKICLNYSLANTIELISELYTFAEKSGINTEIVRESLHQIYAHPSFKLYIDKIHERDFNNVNFNMLGGNKDLTIFQEAFTRVGVVPEIGNIVKARIVSALAQNMQEKDWSSIYEIVRLQAGLIH